LRRKPGAGIAVAFVIGLLQAAICSADTAYLAVIIDDLGNARAAGERAAALPGAATCSILPHTPYAAHLAELCTETGKEVFVHLPMQPESPDADPGPGALIVGQSREQLRLAVTAGLDSIPGASGINSHMGSLFTRHIGYMEWLMTELSQRGDLVFVDSATTAHSMALRMAARHGVPAARRDLFLDDDPSAVAVRDKWEQAVATARRDGAAIAIGHPRDETLSVLETEMAAVGARDIILISIGELISIRQGKGVPSWQESLSRSQQASRR
jgi:polysaccharide deacetylase 2 family uncharacterized protein YibQ